MRTVFLDRLLLKKSMTYTQTMSAQVTILAFALFVTGCTGTGANDVDSCEPGVNCESPNPASTAPVARLGSFEGAPGGVPEVWFRSTGEWRMVILHEFGITEGLGIQFENMTWSDLVEWPSDPAQGERPFAAKEDSKGYLHVVFPRQNALWYYSTSPDFGIGQEIIANDVGVAPRPAMEISETGEIFVTFFNEADNALCLGELAPGTNSNWGVEVIPRPSDACSLEDCSALAYGGFSDLAIVGNSPYAVFYDQHFGNLLFSARLGGIWVGQVMDGQEQETKADTGDMGLWPDLFLDTNGFCHSAILGEQVPTSATPN